jgi:hypothetical protein
VDLLRKLSDRHRNYQSKKRVIQRNDKWLNACFAKSVPQIQKSTSLADGGRTTFPTMACPQIAKCTIWSRPHQVKGYIQDLLEDLDWSIEVIKQLTRLSAPNAIVPG